MQVTAFAHNIEQAAHKLWLSAGIFVKSNVRRGCFWGCPEGFPPRKIFWGGGVIFHGEMSRGNIRGLSGVGVRNRIPCRIQVHMCVAAVIRATKFNTDRQVLNGYVRLAEPAEQNIMACSVCLCCCC